MRQLIKKYDWAINMGQPVGLINSNIPREREGGRETERETEKNM